MLFVHLLFISSVNKYTIISALQNCRFVQIQSVLQLDIFSLKIFYLSNLLTKCFNSTLQDFHYIEILSLRQCSFAFVRHIYTTNTLLVLNVKMRKTRPIYDNLVLNDENCLDGKANNFQLPQLNFGWRSTCAYLTVGERQCLNQAVVLQQLRVVLIKDQLSHLCPQINCSRVELSVEHHRRKPLR